MLRRCSKIVVLAAVFTAVFAAPAWAEGAPGAAAIDTGDTTFVLVSAALVMLMTLPGLALFYGGLSRKKNVLSTIMYSFFALIIISIQWVLFGYSLAFGPDVGHLLGNLDWIGLHNVGLLPFSAYSSTVPHQAFMVFQMMFAVITPALISGAFAERMRFPAFLAFLLLWTTVVYDPVCHWVWGAGGWLRSLGALDFAGGTVVHVLSGVSALVAALVVGRRKNYGVESMIPHNLPFTVTGAALLWFGWFGFNAGSALSAGGLAVNAFVVTHVSAAAAALSWVAVEWKRHGKPTTLGAASGAVAGLVAITPAAGFVDATAAIVIGLVAGMICYLAVAVAKAKFRYDDALDAFGVHGIGGTWGAIATGLFANPAVNAAGAGLFYGNPGQLLKQLIGVGASAAAAVIGTLVILKIVSLFCTLRATDNEQDSGLDFSLHGEDAYTDLAVSEPSFNGSGMLSIPEQSR